MNQQASTLPILREELVIQPVEPDPDGEPAFLLHDPLANRHFRLSASYIELMSLLDSRDLEDMCQRGSILLDRAITTEEAETLINFLRINNLVKTDEQQLTWINEQRTAKEKRPWLEYIVRAPIFIRIPLWNPDKFLESTLPYARLLASGVALRLYIGCALVGLFAISQQTEKFLGTFLYFFSPEGIITFVISIILVKVCHELGHAYTAKHYGCRVPVIGVAFIVGWPVLYTDTSTTWKIFSHRERLSVGIAGMAVELAIASLALMTWLVLDDGILRSIAFILATTTWILSLLVNLNPLMKFDGYYLLSDWLKVPNLEQRSFALARWFIRERLFNLNHSPPEEPKFTLIVFGFAVWIYRALLFLGISLLIYSVLFKALGIIFFFATVWIFIGQPIFKELRFWIEHRNEISWNRHTGISAAVSVLLISLVTLPWKTTVSLPAYASSGQVDFYAPEDGKLIYLASRGQHLKKGDVIAQFVSPELDKEIRLTKLKTQELRAMAAVVGFRAETIKERRLFETELLSEERKLASLQRKFSSLTIKAQENGTLTDLPDDLTGQQWITKSSRIGSMVIDDSTKIIAYANERDLGRLKVGMQAYFLPETLAFEASNLEITGIAESATRSLDQLYLASLFGGDIAVREDADGRLPTQHSLYKINLDAPALQTSTVQRGTCVITAERSSLLERIYRSFFATAVNEAAF